MQSVTPCCLRLFWALTCGALMLCSQAVLASDEVIPVLDTGSQIYSNVTLISKSATHVFSKHSRGFGGLKINELTSDALKKLGMGGPEQAPPTPSKISVAPIATSIRNSFNDSPA